MQRGQHNVVSNCNLLRLHYVDNSIEPNTTRAPYRDDESRDGARVVCRYNVEATKRVIIAQTELRCRAEHPSGRKVPRFRGRLHDAILAVVPFKCVPTGRIFRDASDVKVGFLPARCDECKLFTEYEVVTPEIMQEGAA